MSAKKSVSIPVKVERSARPKKRPDKAPTAPVMASTKAEPAAKHPLQQPVHQLPDHHKKRLMWGIVAVGMFIIMLGWAMSLGNVLKQDNREVSLLQQISSLFRSFDISGQPADDQAEEIRQLEDQVFPQF